MLLFICSQSKFFIYKILNSSLARFVRACVIIINPFGHGKLRYHMNRMLKRRTCCPKHRHLQMKILLLFFALLVRLSLYLTCSPKSKSKAMVNFDIVTQHRKIVMKALSTHGKQNSQLNLLSFGQKEIFMLNTSTFSELRSRIAISQINLEGKYFMTSINDFARNLPRVS